MKTHAHFLIATLMFATSISYAKNSFVELQQAALRNQPISQTSEKLLARDSENDFGFNIQNQEGRRQALAFIAREAANASACRAEEGRDKIDSRKDDLLVLVKFTAKIRDLSSGNQKRVAVQIEEEIARNFESMIQGTCP